MNRTILALAASVFASLTIFGAAAQAACISCEHVPVVVRGHTTADTSPSYARKRYLKKRAYAANQRRLLAAKKRAAQKRLIAKRKAIAKQKAIAKRQAIAKASALAEAAKDIDIEVMTEQSSISTASLGKDQTSTDTAETAKEKKVEAKQSCKKFFPTIAMTLTVPCEE